MKAELLRLAAELASREEAFAVATVIRREAPSSAQVGDTALVLRDGTFHGWLGGSCTRPTVLREALRSIADGTPRLLSLSPDPDRQARAGVTALRLTCHSGGTVDIYVEPVLPAPRLVVFGASPVARALVRMGSVLGYQGEIVDAEAASPANPLAERVLRELPDTDARYRGACVVVALVGEGDEVEAIETALRLEPTYLGVVASRKRMAQVRDALRARGRTAEELAGVSSPAGLDIGARTPEEIALSILAQIVQARRQRTAPEQPLAESPAGEGPTEAVDPVCGMTVHIASARFTAQGPNGTVYFCAAGCRDRYLADPGRWATTEPRAGPV